MSTAPFLTRHRHWIGLALMLILSGLAQAQSYFPEQTSLKIGEQTIAVEVARTPEERSQGLMFRSELPANRGMVFVFSPDAQQCMWMKNTRIPLTVAFIEANGRIQNLARMTPESQEIHCSKGKVRYALEMNQGWFERRGIGPGSQLSGLPR